VTSTEPSRDSVVIALRRSCFSARANGGLVASSSANRLGEPLFDRVRSGPDGSGARSSPDHRRSRALFRTPDVLVLGEPGRPLAVTALVA